MRLAHVRRLAPAVFVALAVAGCRSEEAPYLATEGGGFIFNYRLAEAYAGIIVGPRPNRKLPTGSAIEVSFENPGGGAPIVHRVDVTTPNQLRYTFTTGALSGVAAGRPYAVTIRLIGADGVEVERIVEIFRSNVDQSVLPDEPPVIGPGYTRNPEATR